MKKSLITLCLCSALLFSSCQFKQSPSEPDTIPPKNDPAPTVTTESPKQEPETPAPETPDQTTDYMENVAYKEIPLVPSNSFSTHLFGKRQGNLMVKMSLPSGWEFTGRSEDEFVITREGKEIGRIVYGTTEDTDEWKPVETKKYSLIGGELEAYIEKSGTGDSLAFRRRFCYYYYRMADATLTLTVDYAELDNKAKNKLISDPICETVGNDPCFGVLAEEEKNHILILGNSFIWSSNVGGILQEMMNKNGRDCQVYYSSRGMATVATYVNDESLMREIRGGLYDIVFICGFYSLSEINNFSLLKNACDESDTKLVIFPAHNESLDAVNTAASMYSDVTLINWKNDISLLIQSGVDKWDMCADDYHLHSTHLAGYVGAHAIYRALYNCVPTAPLTNTIDQSYVNSKLGDYVLNGTVSPYPLKSLHFFE